MLFFVKVSRRKIFFPIWDGIISEKLRGHIMKRYLISEASAITGLEAHVLRYWEEELGMKIPRNELGHRYYTDTEIEIFQKAKEMKIRVISLRQSKPRFLEKRI